VAMEDAYAGGGPWLDAVLALLARNVALVRDALADVPEVGLIEPEGTFLLWLDFRALGLAPDKLTEFLRGRAGWALTRGEAFGREGEGFARLNIGCTPARLKAALGQLKRALHR